jgi:hypothetical protein
MRLSGFLVLTALVALLVPAAAGAEDRRSPNLDLVTTFSYPARDAEEGTPNQGTDLEFGTIRGRRYAFAGSYQNGLHIFDVTNGDRPRRIRRYDCSVEQGDVQVFRQRSRTYVTFTNDYYGDIDSTCYRELARRGFDVADEEQDGGGKLGTIIIDVTDPNKPSAVSFVPFEQGSHNMTVHPSGRYLYNSNSDLITSLEPAIEVFDISDLRRPRSAGELELQALPGLGTESHDITFNERGDRAYSAALSHGVVIDTSDPANPRVISEFDDETINVWHQSDPVRIGDRDFLIVEDEFAGAAGGSVCPTGGVHIYDITGERERNPVKVGYWNIDDVQASSNPLDTCTAHVFDIHEDQQLMTIAYYMGGVRVVDLSGLADLPLPGAVSSGAAAPAGGLREIAFYDAEDANTWAVKAPFIEPDGDFHMYGNDLNRGLDVYRFDAQAERSSSPGQFLSPAAARQRLLAAGARTAPRSTRRGFCLLPVQQRQRRARR